MKRVVAVLVVSFLMILMVAAAAISYLRGSQGLSAIGREETIVQLALPDAGDQAQAPSRVQARLDVGALGPDDLTLLDYRVQNMGTRSGFLDIVQVTLHDYEHGCQASEREAGDLSCGNPGDQEGELRQVSLLRLFHDAACDAVLNAGDQFLYGTPVSTMPPALPLHLPLEPNKDLCLVFAFERVQSSQLTHGALVEGDSLEVDLVFELLP